MSRSLPEDVGLESIANQIEKHHIGGLMVIGGFEVLKTKTNKNGCDLVCLYCFITSGIQHV